MESETDAQHEQDGCDSVKTTNDEDDGCDSIGTNNNDEDGCDSVKIHYDNDEISDSEEEMQNFEDQQNSGQVVNQKNVNDEENNVYQSSDDSDGEIDNVSNVSIESGENDIKPMQSTCGEKVNVEKEKGAASEHIENNELSDTSDEEVESNDSDEGEDSDVQLKNNFTVHSKTSDDGDRQRSIEHDDVSNEEIETDRLEHRLSDFGGEHLRKNGSKTENKTDIPQENDRNEEFGSAVPAEQDVTTFIYNSNGVQSMQDVSDNEDSRTGDESENEGKSVNYPDSGREDISEEEQDEMFEESKETTDSDFNKLDLKEIVPSTKIEFENGTVNTDNKPNRDTVMIETSGTKKVKSRTSFIEDHVELDYEEDVIEDGKTQDDSKEKLDDSREEGEVNDGEFSDKDDGEVEDDEDCEEGEIKEPGGRRIFTKPICRFYIKGHCTWGLNCRFLHPGINDKGNYRLIERPGFNNEGMGPWGPFGRGGPRGPDTNFEPELPPRPPTPPPAESAWERGVRNAKELRKKATERKEQESNFEDKKLNLSLPLDDEKDHNKENDRHRTIVKDPYYDQQYDEDIYDKSAVPEPLPGFHQGQYENFEIRWNREPEFLPFRDRVPEREKFLRERIYSPSPTPPSQIERYERHERREKVRDERMDNIPRRPKADEWHDPWRRSKSPKGKRHSSRSRSRGRARRRSRRSYSYSSSYSSSSFSGSSRSRSRSSSYSSYSSRSSYSHSSSLSSRSSVSPHRSPKRARKEPLPPGIGSQKVVLPPRGNDQPRSAVAVKSKNRSPEKHLRNPLSTGTNRPLPSQQKPPAKPFHMILNPIQQPILTADRGKKKDKPPPSRREVHTPVDKPVQPRRDIPVERPKPPFKDSSIEKPKPSRPPDVAKSLGSSSRIPEGGKGLGLGSKIPDSVKTASSRPPNSLKNASSRPDSVKTGSKRTHNSMKTASGRPPDSMKTASSRVVERKRSISSSGSSLSRTHSRSRVRGDVRSCSSSSSLSRSSSASSLSSVSSKSSTSSSGSADSDHLYRGVGSPVRQGSNVSPLKKKGKEKKVVKVPTKESGRGAASVERVESRQSRVDGRPVLRPEGIGRPVHTTSTKSKDPLKIAGQKSNIKLILSKPGKPTPQQTVRKRPGDPLMSAPPTKRMVPSAFSRAEKPLKKPEISARPPSSSGKQSSAVMKPPTKPTPLSPMKAPSKPQVVAASPAPQKAKKSASNRREELLKQLKAVEDAIARKRSKMQ